MCKRQKTFTIFSKFQMTGPWKILCEKEKKMSSYFITYIFQFYQEKIFFHFFFFNLNVAKWCFFWTLQKLGERRRVKQDKIWFWKMLYMHINTYLFRFYLPTLLLFLLICLSIIGVKHYWQFYKNRWARGHWQLELDIKKDCAIL